MKVVPGKGTGHKGIVELSRRPLYVLLLVLALFLLTQILIGWVWGALSRSLIKTELVVEGTYEKTMDLCGMITFREEIILAPASGFVYYNVENGKRVPADKEIAVISEFPLGQRADTPDEPENGALLQQFKSWLLQEEEELAEDYSHLFPGREAAALHASSAGVVNLVIDGWEEYGPDSTFVYLSEEEYQDTLQEPEVMYSGKQVYRSQPLLRMVDNYAWYYSAVLPAAAGEALADKERGTLYFAFEPEEPVDVQRVEADRRADGDYEITWRVDRKIGDYLFQRWVTAELVYDTAQGILLPQEAYWEQDGVEGVFVIKHGMVQFIELKVLAERGDYFLVTGLSPYQQVVTNPGRVREGQRFRP